MALSKPLLRLLADGHFYSGSQLGERLGCSRAAVWKMIRALEEVGVDIFHVRGKGYRLAQPIELLDEKRILAELPDHSRRSLAELTVRFGIDSTNSWLLERPLAKGDVARACLAEFQRLGRGRRGRNWVSPFGGNIYLSLRYRFARGATQLGGLSLAVGVALCEVLRAEGAVGLGLKWPNDVLLDGQKLAGVLLEISGETNGPCEVVIGVGVNLRSTGLRGAAIDQPWADLESALGRQVSRNSLAARLLHRLLETAACYDSQGFEIFRKAWEMSDILAGREVLLKMPAGEVSGVMQGVDEDGALILSLPNGELRRFHGGEVSLRPAEPALSGHA